MPLTPAKCPNCGGVLEVDSVNDCAICQYCSTPFIVEKAINNYKYITNNSISNTINNVTNINGGNVTINQDELNRFFVIEGTTLVKYNGAQQTLRLPDNVQEIASGAFYNSKVKELIVPPTVKIIRSGALSVHTTIIEPNPDIVLEKNFDGATFNTIIFKGEFGSIGGIQSNRSIAPKFIRYYGKEEDFYSRCKNSKDSISSTALLLNDEEPKIYEFRNGAGFLSKVAYALNDKNQATILSVGDLWVTWSHEKSIENVINLSEIEGHKVIGFRGNALNDFIDDLYSESYLYDTHTTSELRLPEGLEVLPTPKGYNRSGVCAKNIYLPASLKIIEKDAIRAWNKVIFSKNSKLERVEDGAFTVKNFSRYTFEHVNLPKSVKYVGEDVKAIASTTKKEKFVIESKTIRGGFIVKSDDFSKVIAIKNDVTNIYLPEDILKEYYLYTPQGKNIGQIMPYPVINKLHKKLFGYSIKYDW